VHASGPADHDYHRRPGVGGDGADPNKDELAADAVSINNVGGFTGSYNRGLGGDAKVTMAGRTYDISGTADGFATADPSFRTSGTFAIKVAC
jgi:lipoprotein LpqH